MKLRLIGTALLLGASCFAAPADGQSGSTVMGCLQKAEGAPGYVITEGTGAGAAVTGPNKLAKFVGHWVKLTGESTALEGKAHFRVHDIQEIAATCNQPTNETAGLAGKPAPAAKPKGSTDRRTAMAELKDSKGKTVGRADLTQVPNGVLLQVKFDGMKPGRHAFHIHETGKCDAPDFKSAGGHFNPDNSSHGYLSGTNYHAGDMPNIDVPKGGSTVVEVLNGKVTLMPNESNSLLGGEGHAIVVHEGMDDYTSQPSGDAGSRIACGVIRGM